MKKTANPHPTRSKLSVLSQLCNLIPPYLVPKLARQTGVDKRTRSYSAWSHVVSMLYAQLAHSIGLNDLCDALRLHRGPLSALRGATPPSRNNLSHANGVRDAALAEKLFWGVLEHLQHQHPRFGRAKSAKGLWKRFRRLIHIVDSTTVQLVADCMDWAKHRRRKAAAKCHMKLNLQSFLPSFAIVDTAAEHDQKRARELCAGIFAGEIVIFDKAYVDFGHLGDLDRRGVFWVTRAKANMCYRVIQKRKIAKDSKILRDEMITLKGAHPDAPQQMRRIEALVEVDGKERSMVFLTNNLIWSARSVTDLYRCRWEIEVFFKQIKQTLQLSDFLGHSANAVRWQIWTALLTYLLMRFQSFLSKWEGSLPRLLTLLRAALWQSLDVFSLLKSYGTAKVRLRMRAVPDQAYLPNLG